VRRAATLAFLAFALVWGAACTPGGAPSPTPVPPTPTVPSTATPSALPLEVSQEAALLPEFESHLADLPQATRYAITVTLEEEEQLLQGEAHVHYTNTEAVPLDELVLRLFPNLPGQNSGLELTDLQVAGHPAEVNYRLEESAAHLPLKPPLDPGQALTLTMAFQTRVPTEGSVGYGAFGVRGDTWTLAGFYPLIAVFDDEGWNEEIPAEYGDMVYSDAAFYRVALTLPRGYQVASTGSVAAHEETDGVSTWTIVSGPARDFNLTFSRDYQVASREDESGTLVRSFYHADHAAMGEAALEYASSAFRLYSELFGPYPYREVDLAEATITAAGIEYPGLIIMAESLYERQDSFTEFVVAHEMAHQWWYGLVGNDQLDEPWLDEALANYSTVLYFERVHGPEEAEGILDSFRHRYEELVDQGRDAPVAQPVSGFRQEDYGRLVYQKGALFFDALRQEVGDATFFAILRQYLAQYRYDVAQGQDFLRVAEAVSGKNLKPLSDRWLFGVESPE